MLRCVAVHGERSNLFYLMDTPTYSGMDAVWVWVWVCMGIDRQLLLLLYSKGSLSPSLCGPFILFLFLISSQKSIQMGGNTTTANARC